MTNYKSIYISPHFDDAIFSCGGQILKQLRKGDSVLIITIFSAENEERQYEENLVAQEAGYKTLFLNFEEAPLRSKRYKFSFNLHKSPSSDDAAIFQKLCFNLKEALDGMDYERCYMPLAVRKHIDHFLVFKACKQIVPVEKRFFYEDVPYCMIKYQIDRRLNEICCNGEKVSLTAELDGLLKYYHDHPNFKKQFIKKLVVKSGLFALGCFLFVMKARFTFQSESQHMEIVPEIEDITGLFEEKLKLIKLYKSQWNKLFGNEDFYRSISKEHSKSIVKDESKIVERYWRYSHSHTL